MGRTPFGTQRRLATLRYFAVTLHDAAEFVAMRVHSRQPVEFTEARQRGTPIQDLAK